MEGVVWFLFTTYSKVQKERNKLREELLNIKEPALDHLEGSNLIQIAKIRKFIVEKTHSRESTKSVAGQHFAEEIRYVTDGSNTRSQQKPGIEVGSSRNIWRHGVDPFDIHRRPTRFVRMLY